MIPELTYLNYAVLLLVVHMLVQGGANTAVRGIAWNMGPRDDISTETGLIAGRLERALQNYVYNLPAFVALALSLKITQLNTDTTALGAAIWFWARVTYLPAYVSGLPFIRSIVWSVSLIGLGLMIAPLLAT